MLRHVTLHKNYIFGRMQVWIILIPMFVGKLTDFGPKWNLSTGDFSATNAPILGLNFRIKPLEVWIVQVIKTKQKYNQFWICGSCRLGQGWGGGEKSQEHSPISKTLSIIRLTKLLGCRNLWSLKPDQGKHGLSSVGGMYVLLLYLRRYYSVKVLFYF